MAVQEEMVVNEQQKEDKREKDRADDRHRFPADPRSKIFLYHLIETDDYKHCTVTKKPMQPESAVTTNAFGPLIRTFGSTLPQN